MAIAFQPPLAFIAGPTASGKSALALALAEQTGGVIINADSAQVYRDLPMSQRRADQAELRAAPAPALRRARRRRCPARRRTGRRWRGARSPSVHARGRLPILVGGTGLYLRTLLDGIAPVPAIDPRVGARSATRRSRTIARARGARSRGGGAARPGRHHPDRPRAGGGAVDRADRSPNGSRSARAGSAIESRFGRWSCCRRATGSTPAATSASRG